jgi:D-glycero-D-manno-heptose 1,7-bisphosphate phosphatase
MLSWIGNLETTATEFVFLDRDGVLNRDRLDYVKNREEFQFYPDALSALQWLRQRDVAVIVISNQSVLNRGYTDWDSFWQMHHAMIGAVRRAGGDILAAYYCPHRPDENCLCRKPSPEMIFSAVRTLGAVTASAAMIGDRYTDILTARRAGCRAVLLDRPEASAGDPGAADPAASAPDDRFTSLWEAVQALYAPSSV